MIYVDNFYLHPLSVHKQMRMSHLFSYDEVALHEFAAQLGLRRSWFHRDHYDIGYGKRERALQMGAVNIRYRLMSRMVTTYRRTGGATRIIPRRFYP